MDVPGLDADGAVEKVILIGEDLVFIAILARAVVDDADGDLFIAKAVFFEEGGESFLDGFGFAVEAGDFIGVLSFDGKSDAPVRAVGLDAALGEAFCFGGVEGYFGIVESLGDKKAADGNASDDSTLTQLS